MEMHEDVKPDMLINILIASVSSLLQKDLTDSLICGLIELGYLYILQSHVISAIVIAHDSVWKSRLKSINAGTKLNYMEFRRPPDTKVDVRNGSCGSTNEFIIYGPQNLTGNGN